MTYDNKQPYIYCVQEMQNYDYSDAERFGEMIFLTHKEYNMSAKNSEMNKEILQNAVSRLANFNPDKDYLLLTGAIITQGLCLAYLWNRGFTKLRCLKFDNRIQRYQSHDVSVPLQLIKED